MSKMYNYVWKCYKAGTWSKAWVWDAVDLWITADEYKLITGDEWDPENRPK